jgi:hypothetical protein
MKQKSFDLLLVDLLVIASALVILTPGQLSGVRIPLGILMTLVLPGYALTAALFPNPPLPWIERLTLTSGLSLCSSTLGGLYVYWGVKSLNAETWMVFLGGITISASLVALFRRTRFSIVKSPHNPNSRFTLLGFLSVVSQGLVYSLAIVMVISAVQFAQFIAKDQPHSEIVQMWMLPDQRNPEHWVQLGLTTKTMNPHRFSVVVKRGNDVIKEWPNIQMGSDDQWETNLVLTTPLPGTGPIEAFLYNLDDPNQIYRHVSLWPK